MSGIISVSIDVTKIDKSKLKDGKYLNLSLFINDELDKFDNNVSVTHSQTKAEQDAKENKIYLGNGRVMYVKDGIKTSKDCKSKTVFEAKNNSNELENLPF